MLGKITQDNLREINLNMFFFINKVIQFKGKSEQNLNRTKMNYPIPITDI